MAERTIVGLSGNLARPSRTRLLVREILDSVEARGLGRTVLHDLVDAAPELGAAIRRDDLPAAPERVIAAIEQADALVVATPVYKAAYTGLFKHLFDLIDPRMLEGRPVILAATGGSHRHALVIEHHLRPLFAFFRAHAAPIGLYAADADFTPEGALTEEMRARIAPAVDQIDGLLRVRASAPAVPTLRVA
ncbi:MAG: FMN reductase [Rhizobiales bacterium]|nr:FMN reductase [Hyphomicrobiales bacterium]